LHQGTIALVAPCEHYLSEVLLPSSRVLEAMKHYTHPLLKAETTEKERREAKTEIEQLLFNQLVDTQ
jgi:hypothetical protein